MYSRTQTRVCTHLRTQYVLYFSFSLANSPARSFARSRVHTRNINYQSTHFILCLLLSPAHKCVCICMSVYVYTLAVGLSVTLWKHYIHRRQYIKENVIPIGDFEFYFIWKYWEWYIILTGINFRIRQIIFIRIKHAWTREWWSRSSLSD